MNAYQKKKIISKIAPVVTATGVPNLFEGRYGGIGHILMFHRVVPDSKKKRVHNHLSLEVTPEHLERTIKFFAEKNYNFISIDQLDERLGNEVCDNKRFVVFTFDDGFRDNLEIAYPIFKKYGVPFTVYVTTGMPNHTAVLWWYILEDMLLERDNVHFTWKKKQYSYESKTSDQKEKAFESIQHFVHQNFSLDDHLQLLQAIFKDFQSDLTRHSSELGMNWDEIRLLNQDPLVTIGAHTVNHYNLSKLPPEALKREILDSKIELERQLGQPIEHFAYPYGKTHHASEREYNCTEDLGFKTAVSTNIGNLFAENFHRPYSLPRININRVTDEHVLKLQTSGLIPFLVNKGKSIIR
ncbi:polysaccharide deacetylase family protein [Maribacter algicola]|uniref:Polysaccharide deacetylase family protein n=1 Tax=Meishania litoralis TaxID=3434685 RepID=A0ACC7LK90_9FLAO